MRTGNPGHLKAFDYVGFHARDAVDVVLAQIVRAADDEQFAILAYCFMPDHLHILAEAESESADARRFIKRAKQLSGFYYSKQSGGQLWQRYGYERVLRSEDDTLGVAKYVLENPVRGGLVQSPQDYEFSGSTKYTVQEILDAVSWRGPKSA